MFIDDSIYDETKSKIESNLRTIDQLNKKSLENKDDPKYWFEAWSLLKETASLVEELEQEYYRLNGKENVVSAIRIYRQRSASMGAVKIH